MIDPFAPIDIVPRDLHTTESLRLEFRVTPMGSCIMVVVLWGNQVISTGSGASLGEAMMVAGALLTGTPVRPIPRRLLRALRKASRA